MKIAALVENTSGNDLLASEHGLSLYIETKHHKLLFDTGASNLFLENANKMNIDLSAVDSVVISHGHYDHGGGLKTFLNMNDKAKVYIHREAFGNYYSNQQSGEKKYIGLDKSLLPNERFIFVGENFRMDEELELFSKVKGSKLSPSGNSDLYIKNGETYTQDKFEHEQNLIIKENGKHTLIAGCAHNGIVNILEHFKTTKGVMPNYVIGGFHLYNHAKKRNEAEDIVLKMADFLLETKAKYYTCHCTGVKSFETMKQILLNSIEYLSTGNEIKL